MADAPSGGAARWSDLGRRVVSAAVLAPAALLCIWVGALPFDVLIVVAALGLSLEWVALCGVEARGLAGLMVPAFLVLAGVACAAEQAPTGLALLACGFALLCAVTRKLLLAAGVLYIGLPLIALLWLRRGVGGRDDVLFLILVIWASDIGAYLVGRLLRGPRLAPALSPGKTWSGAIGGLIAALLVGLLAPFGAPTLALLLGVVGQAGDLLESAIKRHVGVKDSGRLIPGHGGLFDRLDGVLAAAPIFALAVLGSRGGHW